MTQLICLPRTWLLSILFFAVLHPARAQQTGYYVSLTHDTIRGVFPHYTASYFNPGSLTFQPNGASEDLKLTPANFLAVAIDGSDKFIPYHGQRLTNPATDAQAQTGGRADEYEDITTFLREIYNDGTYRLYKYTDARRNNFYAGGDTLQELYYKIYVEDREVKEALQFRQQLFVIFRTKIDADPRLKEKLVYTGYSEANLLYFFTVAAGHGQKPARKNFPDRFFVGAGGSANFFSVDVHDVYILVARGSFAVNYSPVLQAGVQLPLGRGSDRFFLQFLLQGYGFKTSNSQEHVGSDSYKGLVFNLPMGAGYKVLKAGGFTLALEGGFGPNLTVSSTHDHVDYGNNAQNYHSNEPSRVQFNFFGGVEAFVGKAFSVVGNYYGPIGTRADDGFYPKHSAAQFVLRYGL
jgi:hypothetical protein